MMTNGGENIAKFALPSRGVTDAIGRKQGNLERVGNFDGGAIAGFLLPMKMALQFHVDAVMAKNVRQPLDPVARFFHATVSESKGQRSVVVAGKANQSCC